MQIADGGTKLPGITIQSSELHHLYILLDTMFFSVERIQCFQSLLCTVAPFFLHS
jgi:hypothetical protein